MNRIGYRIFEPENNEFRYSGSTPSMLSIFFEKTAVLNTLHKMPYQQLTSLKDKNGTEIYEGDVVSGGMLRCTGGYSIANDKTTVRFESGMFKAGSISLNSVARSCEVIGNIYQHPELLRSETNASVD